MIEALRKRSASQPRQMPASPSISSDPTRPPASVMAWLGGIYARMVPRSMDRLVSCLAYSFCSIAMVLANKGLASYSGPRKPSDKSIEVLPGKADRHRARCECATRPWPTMPHNHAHAITPTFWPLPSWPSLDPRASTCSSAPPSSPTPHRSLADPVVFQNLCAVGFLELLRSCQAVSFERVTLLTPAGRAQCRGVMPLTANFVAMIFSGFMCLK